ncbi:YceI family protein [Microbulbifer taiwanensis]|uniref:YceI family protein n=1 Tax=Microbulbifer taiwanensis TaxID=986746 RepID=A0ABW1YKK5_9GAMM|nr:YceI family protein [Microbulbifer taiwanensis]
MFHRSARLFSLLLLLAGPVSAESVDFAIDSPASDIHWRIYSDGPLPLGHNHIISTSRISGSVRLADAPEASHFELLIPVAALLVDSPALRQRYGKQFSSRVSPRARAGTRANMLGNSLLNAAHHPDIRLGGSAVVARDKRRQNLVLDTTLELAGRSIRLKIPAQIEFGDREVRARGHFTLSHSQLGLAPFRAALGALRVADNIDFTYDIQARRTE